MVVLLLPGWCSCDTLRPTHIAGGGQTVTARCVRLSRPAVTDWLTHTTTRPDPLLASKVYPVGCIIPTVGPGCVSWGADGAPCRAPGRRSSSVCRVGASRAEQLTACSAPCCHKPPPLVAGLPFILTYNAPGPSAPLVSAGQAGYVRGRHVVGGAGSFVITGAVRGNNHTGLYKDGA